MALKNARRRNKGKYSNIIPNYASIILIVAVAVLSLLVIMLGRPFLMYVWEMPVKLLIKIFTNVHIHSYCL
jgi:hypothetical protein